jgi:hypothetical protein
LNCYEQSHKHRDTVTPTDSTASYRTNCATILAQLQELATSLQQNTIASKLHTAHTRCINFHNALSDGGDVIDLVEYDRSPLANRNEFALIDSELDGSRVLPADREQTTLVGGYRVLDTLTRLRAGQFQDNNKLGVIARMLTKFPRCHVDALTVSDSDQLDAKLFYSNHVLLNRPLILNGSIHNHGSF